MLIIQTTSNSKNKLKSIAKELLEQKLTACTHINKIYSSYTWEGKIINEKEYRLEIKTIKKHEKTIFSIIKELHNYNIFELLSYDVSNLNIDYKKWFKNQLKSIK